MKFPTPGSSLSLLGKNIKLGRGEGNIMAVGKNIMLERESPGAISSFLIIQAV